uniref:OSBPL6 n=1 Tax=Pantodon buchholzi TaxID=8276 RepID=A0A088FMW2_PANBU|nr:OSBPL6 [Pantodon buchholzi]
MGGQDKTPPGSSKPTHSRNNSSSSSSRYSHQLSIPGICEGYLMKKKKWPLNGWHKIVKGKLHGSLDVSLAVMSVNKKAKRIDLDGGHTLYHIKAKSHEIFYIWLTKLCAHRVYKKNEAFHLHQGVLQALSSGTDGLPSIASLAQRNLVLPDMYQSSATLYQSESMTLKEEQETGVSKVSAWLDQHQEVDRCSQELAQSHVDLMELNHLVQKLQMLEKGLPITAGDLEHRISMQFGHSRTLSGVEHSQFTSSHLSTSTRLGASMQSIPSYVYSQLSTPCLASPEGVKIQEDICKLSQRLQTSLKSVYEALALERERLRQAWTGPDLRHSTTHQLASLCTTLTELEMQSRLTKVHSLSLSSDSTEQSFCTVRQDEVRQPFSPLDSRTHQLIIFASFCDLNTQVTSSHRFTRPPSVADSMAEYFDASEVPNCESSSENEVSDESGLSDVTASNSEPEEIHGASAANYRASISSAPDVPRTILEDTGRRSTLPATCPDNSHIGLMTILYNNIGKDLSRVSMPAALNEPLCMLQRLCEDLEYSELLDKADHVDDPYERMLYIAAFSISSYAWATYRNRYKPFNPVLGETFECVREDKGFRYTSEQRFKNKFWGKSLEIIPTGMVNVTLSRYGDHYEWNKVVTCIHNVFSQQRWLEHYGEVLIHNTKSNVCTCKITFVKSRYWGSENNVNEVQGAVLNQAGEVVHRFGGFWHQGIFCDTLPTPKCLWKPTPQPENSFLYFGFSRFAMELNELMPEMHSVLPPTDTRFRPDQRLLEEGKVNESDGRKDEVEEKQRTRRKLLAKKGEEHMPRFFSSSTSETTPLKWRLPVPYAKTQSAFLNPSRTKKSCVNRHVGDVTRSVLAEAEVRVSRLA